MKFSNKIRTHVFLDLELTLIEEWHKPFSFNQEPILRSWIESFASRGTRVQFHLFTWAIDNHSEMGNFKKAILPIIEAEFGMTITNIVTKDDCIAATKAIRKIQVLDHMDLSQLIGKGDAFFDFCKFHRITKSVLFDDTVENIHLKFNDENCVAETYNVEFIKG